MRDSRCPSVLKVNYKSFKEQLDLRDKRYLIFYKTVFSTTPMQLIIVYYKPRKNQFYVLLQHCNNSRSSRVRLPMPLVYQYLPYFSHMINLKQYEHIGARIFKAFKNTLLIQTMEKLNADNDLMPDEGELFFDIPNEGKSIIIRLAQQPSINEGEINKSDLRKQERQELQN